MSFGIQSKISHEEDSDVRNDVLYRLWVGSDGDSSIA
jgi:hypothetical protein